ncbi:MAG TPA: XdhC family protein [Spirochaetales bacterium]|nr:XdhC family protein [Spirochaetales bacterium]
MSLEVIKAVAHIAQGQGASAAGEGVAGVTGMMRGAGAAGGVVAVVSEVRGSAPRHVGAMMFFRADGTSVGTVGGGKVEQETARAAAACLATGCSTCIEIDMTGSEATGSQGICGGVVQLLLSYERPGEGSGLSPNGGNQEVDRTGTNLYVQAAQVLERGQAVRLVFDRLSPGKLKAGGLLNAVLDRQGSSIVAKRGREKANRESGAQDAKEEMLVVPVEPLDQLLILGGGHVGAALVRLATELDFKVFVADHRPAFVVESRFPAGVTTILGPYEKTIREFDFGDSSYVIVATPDHEADLACIEALLRRAALENTDRMDHDKADSDPQGARRAPVGYKYLGLIASKRKTKLILEQLETEGFDERAIQAIHAPVGLDIGAETPAEIAVSIAAQIIAVRRGSDAVEALAMDRERR